MNHPTQPSGIPVSVSLDELSQTSKSINAGSTKKRLVYISLLSVFIGICVSGIAVFLVHLINLVTNVFFHKQFAWTEASPLHNHYGLWVIAVPVAGGLIVGLMALYGSKAIRGHGIPEAMEQILTNKSKIKPSITYLKPLSSAISIGTGGPFGSEGPIIATGGALGSTIGQLLKISHYERKILLAAGATAGMSAIFGSPIAAIFLAIELLLFEFSPASIIPVALACITGSAGHHFFFKAGPVFPMPLIETATNSALFLYSILGLLMGCFAALVTKMVYIIEDLFEKIPVHWAWWPALGGIVVGVTGYFVPETLGVGYENITGILSAKMLPAAVFVLGFAKLISWSFALGSGTSGGTLAPLLTIGGAAGILLGQAFQILFPNTVISLPLAALTGMAAMFAGASRALLTSIIFAIETTDQVNALLPLLASCVASYIISYFLMENTIMTEKIARRGIKTPNSFQPDILESLSVEHVLKPHSILLKTTDSIKEVREALNNELNERFNYYVVIDEKRTYKGIVSYSSLMSLLHPDSEKVESLINRKPLNVMISDSLKTAATLMARANVDVLPVTQNDNIVAGILSFKDILSAFDEHSKLNEVSVPISVKRRTLKALIKSRRRFNK